MRKKKDIVRLTELERETCREVIKTFKGTSEKGCRVTARAGCPPPDGTGKSPDGREAYCNKAP